MIHISETLVLQTVEDFLTTDELAQLRKIMDDERHAAGWAPRFQAEVMAAPAMAEEILQHATERALPAIRRAMPSIKAAAPWGYTELTAGHRVPTHLDGIPDPGAVPHRLGRIGVVLEEADRGGEFYVESTSSDDVWTGELVGEAEGFLPGTALTHRLPHAPKPGVHPHESEPAWLGAARRTRWITDAGAGTAVAYGAQVIHGVLPVRSGRLGKFVTDLLDGPGA
ncbi:hypothetical protein [Streptomyces gobiensis]|uniref:hypothetical protein n=1 Tax=Streptomyces gobiensis TaxID=2875706 RepID=UPI001E465837|nr:hypothetical protein [Streptomyces gobiensis]UGY94907.1 hypothetical protein test1122_26330 [Streptomyces gobiensis]